LNPQIHNVQLPFETGDFYKFQLVCVNIISVFDG
jgi:hypothetical protein